MPTPKYGQKYAEAVFVNCPSDAEYGALLDAIVFAVHDCGFVARSALELQNTGRPRITRLLEMVRECRFGIHDLSRTELDPVNHLPRFNMPLELGLFLGAMHFGAARQRAKVCLVLDTEKYRYQKFCSDIAGQDPAAHGGDPAQAIVVVRNWLSPYAAGAVPGGKRMVERYAAFRTDLPAMITAAELDLPPLPFPDYAALVMAWLEASRPT